MAHYDIHAFPEFIKKLDDQLNELSNSLTQALNSYTALLHLCKDYREIYVAD